MNSEEALIEKSVAGAELNKHMRKMEKLGGTVVAEDGKVFDELLIRLRKIPKRARAAAPRLEESDLIFRVWSNDRVRREQSGLDTESMVDVIRIPLAVVYLPSIDRRTAITIAEPGKRSTMFVRETKTSIWTQEKPRLFGVGGNGARGRAPKGSRSPRES